MMGKRDSWVSVVIPTFNSAQFLAATLKSLLAQTYPDWEALVIDGGSTDGTLGLIEAYVQQDPRVQLHHQQGGVSFSRNLGSRLSQGGFVAFLDSDDLWKPEKLATQVQHLQDNPQLGVSFSRAELLNSDGSPTGTLTSGRLQGIRPEHLLYENPTTSMSNIVVRRGILDEIFFDTQLNYAEDLEWLFRVMVLGGWQIEGVQFPLLGYRTNAGGLSSDLYRMEAGWDRYVENARKVAPDLVNQHYPAARAVHLRYLARRALRLGLDPTVAQDFLGRAFQSDWKTLLKDPRRTGLITLAVLGSRWLKG